MLSPRRRGSSVKNKFKRLDSRFRGNDKVRAMFDLEKKLISEGYDFVIGIDEAGRGPLAGPVVACACALKTLGVASLRHPVSKFEMIRDSKKLSEKQRENLFDFIQENFYVGVGICNHLTIDRINILEASFLAMKKAIGDLNKNLLSFPRRRESSVKTNFGDWIPACAGMTTRTIILVDGNKVIPNLSIEQRAIIGGDKIVKSISAASIIAKVTRDRIMREMHMKYPEYNFAQHKGYGTKIHMAALKKYGPCEIHRKSFRPVRESVK